MGAPLTAEEGPEPRPLSEKEWLAAFTKALGSVGRQRELVFLLDNHGEDAVDSGERIHQKDLGTHNREAFVQTFKESDYEILLVASFGKTQARRKGL